MSPETSRVADRFRDEADLSQNSDYLSVKIGEPNQRLSDAIERARACSPFLSGLLDRERDTVDSLLAGQTVPLWLPEEEGVPPAKRLRIARRRLALSVALADLSGAYDLTAVTAALTGFADTALDLAIRTAIRERTPDAEPIGFAAIALGKQGSFELNYSSDIDPILIFDPATLPRRAREEPEDAAVRIGRRVVELLQSRDADGYVLRVDLRLRPSPEVTPIALPVNAAIHYYESQALPWERAAFIRARAAAGDLKLGQRFLRTIQPFVWRRSLDFGAVGEIRGMSHRIRDHHAQGQRLGPGYDLKRGRGGIREVEFYAQIHQLIHGGREPNLRVPATRDALAQLAEAGRIDAQEARALSDAYTLLRTIEHRVQMLEDRQTHTLPADEALDRVARLHGLESGAALLDLLRPHVEAVGRIYDGLEDERPARLPLDPVLLGEALERAGYAETDAPAQRIAAWRGGAYPALRSPAARDALEAVLPGLVEALARAPEPQGALLRLDRLLERLPSAVNTLRLLEARPALAQLLAAILSHAPPLADDLARRPALLDGLMDASAFEPVGTVEVLARAMACADGDYQAALDQIRRVVGEARFALGTQIVAGAADPLEVGEGYARVAEAAIRTIAARTVAEFERAHGRVPGGELVVLALGRMGGGLLTHASDLDLVYLFTGDFHAESDGAKPLGATLYFNRLAQRMTGALSAPTAAGPLYPVDTRLRPSGNKGPLAVSLDSFARYQREEAWTWEHMALTRARVVHGSTEARAATDAIVAQVLAGARPERDIAAEARTMRAEMAAHKPPKGPLDAKLLPGGLVDLEFAVHVLQLAHRAGFEPHLGRAVDALVGAGLLPAGTRDAHDLLTRMLVTLRLVAPDAEPPAPSTRALIARALRLPDWDAAVAEFERTRQSVAELWRDIGGEGGAG
ncbi:bifunctional [glutamine synthetase] adenylyltransferase/[glutamine synthetase]-adenylyl-L-tyrosine phosphorylase [Sphingomonas lenta]|uniref:Bifunctional [glutamate--ammonia ligase]-adenylyl-L-tyrosine phosphorylase/[glutamate--ammonia-ligase] adenylyltransferase n=1 Tax=Sphingomonas lenta TaxID=1141887 RepID=A0A2A2SI41_9SPHN|nr:bifunctional [glutamine synthetase] adenylyltransferase/[glutamine synthetase]-adenylyl-L-tyrosine phosphorylase [Sphingomonas lenta]PAX08691.1 bifunctional [glutamate--ammonia ligase]-adenylyl-L-tyrosine phosphorylase/[glutamate--ammonia-ligase] adenylyltransferase [Sphingomonas lenta]